MIARRLAILCIAALTLGGVSACDPLGRPNLEPAFGARNIDGHLTIWTGSVCYDVIRLSLTFDPNDDDRVELVMSAPPGAGTAVEHFTLGEAVTGLTVIEPLPAAFDWRKAESVRISVRGSAEKGGWGTTTYLTEVIDHSADHPNDTYWFQNVGWLNPAQVTEQDGKTFLATCTDDPAKK